MPCFIADDAPREETLSGVPVLNTKDRAAQKADIIFVSSSHYTDKFSARAKEIWPGKTITNPYAFFTNQQFEELYTDN
jgi:hypothetical protein